MWMCFYFINIVFFNDSFLHVYIWIAITFLCVNVSLIFLTSEKITFFNLDTRLITLTYRKIKFFLQSSKSSNLKIYKLNNIIVMQSVDSE